jgi:hypothetical protein
VTLRFHTLSASARAASGRDNLSCQKQHITKLLLGDDTEVLGISLPDGTVQIDSTVFQSASADINGT